MQSKLFRYDTASRTIPRGVYFSQIVPWQSCKQGGVDLGDVTDVDNVYRDP